MNNYNFTFNNFRKITKSKSYNNFVDLLNSLSGNNIYSKFRTFLEQWIDDVGPSLTLSFQDGSVELFISYILENFPNTLENKKVLNYQSFEVVLDVPKTINYLEDKYLIYDIIQEINIINYSNINLNELSFSDKKKVVDSLPADLFIYIFKEITNDKTVILGLDHQKLKQFIFNFNTNEPFIFLYNLIKNYDENYFRDVIFELSSRINTQTLENSTISDIEYYIKKMTEEKKNLEKTGLDI